MSTFTKLKEEFPVNWGTVSVGWNDASQQLSQITFNEIKEFAFERLESSDCNQSEEEAIIQLLSINQNEADYEDVRNLLFSLSSLSNAKIALEERKWRVMRLDEILKCIPLGTIDGLSALTDFWASYDYTTDSPHVVQGKDNELSPTAYYTDAFFQKMLLVHREWLSKEKQSIRDSDR